MCWDENSHPYKYINFNRSKLLGKEQFLRSILNIYDKENENMNKKYLYFINFKFKFQVQKVQIIYLHKKELSERKNIENRENYRNVWALVG